MQPWTSDVQYTDHVISEVSPNPPDGWSIGLDEGGWHILVPNAHERQRPCLGEVIRLFGRGVGYHVRGIAIVTGPWRVYRYESEDEYQARIERESREERYLRCAKAIEEREERDEKIAALPVEFQHRIARFSRTVENWTADFEPYEIFVCEEAAEMAKVFKTPDDLHAFYQMKCEDQKTLVEANGYTLRLDEHSGNTFGAAVMLARIFLEMPESLWQAHGAMCSLVGCSSYGCYAAYEAKEVIDKFVRGVAAHVRQLDREERRN